VRGKIIEGYGTGPTGTHNDGINIAARPGEPVRAADAGVVAYAGNELRGYGNLALIKHSGGYMTAYAHNSKLLVKRGEVVKRGQEIATAGSTGTVDTPQVHFEIRRGTRAIDPTTLLPSVEASAR
jgi:murein DD-endopeptidase MepM/ murein hydrolase activator NlpD